MRKWLIIGLTKWDQLIVHADIHRLEYGIAIFETLDGNTILETRVFSHILPISNNDYYSDKYRGVPELNKERDNKYVQNGF